MLATCDADGKVEGSIPGFANMAKVSVEQMEQAIERFSATDHYSRSKDFDGRRIEEVPGGWRILNYRAYRAKYQRKSGSRADYMRDYRSRQK
jgi:hypothetical protein